MSTYLYRLGRFAYRRRWLVTAVWLGLLVLVGAGAAALGEETTDDFDIPGVESVEAMQLVNERLPEFELGDGATARVVFVAPEGQTLTDGPNRDAVTAAVAALAQVEDVSPGGVSDPYAPSDPANPDSPPRWVSQDGRIALAEVTFDVPVPAANEELTEAVASAEDAGLTVEMAGTALQEEFEQGGEELFGLGVAALVLIITFGSFIAAGMPLLNAIIGIGVTISAITAATRFIDLSTFTPTLATMLGLALAIDYSLFIVSRYRHELGAGRDGPEAVGRALGTAGSAVVFAGLTVMIALVGLSVVGIPMLAEMGISAALAVAMSVLIALTMLPALLGFAKRRILGGRIPGLRARDPEADDANGKPSLGTRYVRFITRRPIPVLVVVGLAMLALAIPATDLRLGLPDESSMGEDTTQRRAYDLVAEGFGAGVNGPLMVVVDTAGAADPAAAVARVVESVGGLENVVSASPIPLGLDTSGELPEPVLVANDLAVVSVLPETGPTDAETNALVDAIRAAAPGVTADTGATVAVTGFTAIIIDFNQKMTDALLPYLGLVVGLSFLILILVFRSVLVPLKAALGFLLSMGATFGVVVAVFQWGWLTDLLPVNQMGLIISFLPIFLIGVVFGLAMDYQVFLVTRMREEHVHGADPIPAVVTGFQHGSRVVTAAAIIMISVFAGFTLSGEDFILQVALALAVAIALDAFVVRMTLVPAVLALLGRSAWWLPRWLDRIVPRVDVEGEKLRRSLDQEENRTLASTTS